MHKQDDLSRLLKEAYIKVLRVNLTDDTYDEIKVLDEEKDSTHGYNADTISGWLGGFAEAGNVFDEDVERYGVFTQLDSLRRAFLAGRDHISILYRRRNDKGEFRWARMTFIKSYDYTDDHQIIMLYVEDVHDEIMLTYEISEQQRITHALVHMYWICIYVDLDTLTYERIHVAKEFEDAVPRRGTMSDMISATVTQRIIPKDPADLKERFSPEVFCQQLMTQRAYDYEYQATIDGRPVWCRVAAVKVDRHADRTPRHVIIAIQDITKQVELGRQTC